MSLSYKKRFQFGHGNGASRDHAHKYSKLAKANNLIRNVFIVSYATLSLLGKITKSHLTFTKSNAEIEPIIKNIKRIRSIAKSGDLQKHDTENMNGDALLWENYFLTLTQGTTTVFKKVITHHLFLMLP